jgi:SNF2 family DNA or RNA helicase
VTADIDNAEREAPKLPEVREIMAGIRDRGEAALLFTTYLYPARVLEPYLRALGHKVVLHHGGMDRDSRAQAVAQFTDGEADVFISTTTSGGVGLNLTRANHVIHYNRHWNPAVEAQANCRAYRIGQTRPVHVHYLVTANSIEERIVERLRDKRTAADRYLPDGEFELHSLDIAELAGLAGLRFPT